MSVVEQFRGRPLPHSGRWQILRLVLLSIGGLLLTAGVLWLGWHKFQDPEFLPIGVVGVSGELIHMKPEDFKKGISPLIKMGLFAVDVDVVSAEIHKLPWVERVAVRRIWPDKLEITITEFEPLARWGKSSLVNAEGVAFVPNKDEIPLGLPRLWGPEGEEKRVVEQYLSMREPLKLMTMDIVSLHLNDRRSWSMELKGGLMVELGQRDLKARFHRFLRIYPQLMERHTGQILKMDLRYPNGLSVAWSRGSFRK